MMPHLLKPPRSWLQPHGCGPYLILTLGSVLSSPDTFVGLLGFFWKQLWLPLSPSSYWAWCKAAVLTLFSIFSVLFSNSLSFFPHKFNIILVEKHV